jgi:hypothetical protein
MSWSEREQGMRRIPSSPNRGQLGVTLRSSTFLRQKSALVQSPDESLALGSELYEFTT